MDRILIVKYFKSCDRIYCFLMNKIMDLVDHTSIQNDKITPFLKWAGGKRWLINKQPEIFPKHFNRYIEPFIGGGSVYFYIKPANAIIGDLNKELIETYQALKSDWQQVHSYLKTYHEKHSKDFYYAERDKQYRSLSRKAARLIYLNRTCWNGLYRVNRQGKFNVPIGTKTKVILDDDNFPLIANQLATTEIIHADFEPIVEKSTLNDFLFVDPPYTVSHNKNAFVKYNEQLFSWEDQQRLFNSLLRAKQRGVKVLSTNAAHEEVINLYKNDFDIQTISRASVIAGKTSARTKYEEILIKANY